MKSQLTSMIGFVVILFVALLSASLLTSSSIKIKENITAPSIGFVKDYYKLMYYLGARYNFEIDKIFSLQLYNTTRFFLESKYSYMYGDYTVSTYLSILELSFRRDIQNFFPTFITEVIEKTGFTIIPSQIETTVDYVNNRIELEIPLYEVSYAKVYNAYKSKIYYSLTDNYNVILKREYDLSCLKAPIEEFRNFSDPFDYQNFENIINITAQKCVVDKQKNEINGIEGCKFNYMGANINIKAKVFDIKNTEGIYLLNITFLDNGETMYTKNYPIKLEFINVKKPYNMNICNLVNSTLSDHNYPCYCYFNSSIDDCTCVCNW